MAASLFSFICVPLGQACKESVKVGLSIITEVQSMSQSNKHGCFRCHGKCKLVCHKIHEYFLPFHQICHISQSRVPIAFPESNSMIFPWFSMTLASFFHDFSMILAFLSNSMIFPGLENAFFIFQVFHDFPGRWEPCNRRFVICQVKSPLPTWWPLAEGEPKNEMTILGFRYCISIPRLQVQEM